MFGAKKRRGGVSCLLLFEGEIIIIIVRIRIVLIRRIILLMIIRIIDSNTFNNNNNDNAFSLVFRQGRLLSVSLPIVEGSMFWLSDLDLSKVGLRCSKPDALGCCAHPHSKGKVKDYNLVGAAFCIALERLRS